jgi:uncharacterized protein
MALPPFLSEHGGATLVSVRVRPRGGPDAIDGERAGALLVRVAAPPEDGKANRAVCRLVARAAGVPVGRASIARGARGRDKLVRLEDAAAEEVAARLCG